MHKKETTETTSSCFTMTASKTSIMGFLFSGLLAVATFSGSAFAASPRALLADTSYTGLATSYCSNPKKEKMPKCAVPNACDIKTLPSAYTQYFAAVPEHLLDGKCGKCVQVTGAAGTVVAQVIDSFVAPGVAINLSEEALKKATGFASDKKPVSWKFVACAGPVPPSPKPSPPPSPKPSPSHSGIATSYCSNPKKEKMPKCAVPNACGIKALAPAYVQFFAGVPENLLGGNCGKCVLVTGAAGTVKAQVIDSFVARGVTINLSEEALKKATGFASDKKPVSWEFVAC